LIFTANQNGIGASLDGWLTKPFSSDMSVTQWCLFIGLIMVASFAWSRMIRLILDNA
jgi:hypothetical protein